MIIFLISLMPMLIIIVTGMALKTDRPCYYTILEPPGHYVACSIQPEWMYVILTYFGFLITAGWVFIFSIFFFFHPFNLISLTLLLKIKDCNYCPQTKGDTTGK